MNTTENKSRAPKKTKWDKPVTKAFYEKLRRKAAFVVREMHEVPGYIDIIMDHVDRYLLYHEPPYYYTDHMWICSFFAAVRDDIEDAIVRRKRAKERAAERKAARERAKAEAMKTAEPEATNEKSQTEAAHTEATIENTGGNATETAVTDDISANASIENKTCAAKETGQETTQTENMPEKATADIGKEKRETMRSKIARLCGFKRKPHLID